SPTKPSPTKPGAPAPVVEQPSPATRAPLAFAPSRRDGRERLADFLRSEFGGDTVERVRGYFAVIDALMPDAERGLRREHLDSLTERLRLLSKAADDGRPIDASIVLPVFNSIGYTIACVLSLFEHGANSRLKSSSPMTHRVTKPPPCSARSAGSCAASRRRQTRALTEIAIARPERRVAAMSRS